MHILCSCSFRTVCTLYPDFSAADVTDRNHSRDLRCHFKKFVPFFLIVSLFTSGQSFLLNALLPTTPPLLHPLTRRTLFHHHFQAFPIRQPHSSALLPSEIHTSDSPHPALHPSQRPAPQQRCVTHSSFPPRPAPSPPSPPSPQQSSQSQRWSSRSRSPAYHQHHGISRTRPCTAAPMSGRAEPVYWAYSATGSVR